MFANLWYDGKNEKELQKILIEKSRTGIKTITHAQVILNKIRRTKKLQPINSRQIKIKSGHSSTS